MSCHQGEELDRIIIAKYPFDSFDDTFCAQQMVRFCAPNGQFEIGPDSPGPGKYAWIFS